MRPLPDAVGVHSLCYGALWFHPVWATSEARNMGKHDDQGRRVNCGTCNGDGKEPDGSTCSTCGGTGWYWER